MKPVSLVQHPSDNSGLTELWAENENGESTFKRQSSEELAKWMERYTLSQIWSKNLIGACHGDRAAAPPAGRAGHGRHTGR